MTEENDLKDGSGAQPGNRRPDERARRRARPQRVFDTSVPSPCIAVCQVDPASNLCIGCRRHVAEIRDWPLMTPDQKLAVHPAPPGRRSEERTGGTEWGSTGGYPWVPD